MSEFVRRASGTSLYFRLSFPKSLGHFLQAGSPKNNLPMNNSITLYLLRNVNQILLKQSSDTRIHSIFVKLLLLILFSFLIGKFP